MKKSMKIKKVICPECGKTMKYWFVIEIAQREDIEDMRRVLMHQCTSKKCKVGYIYIYKNDMYGRPTSTLFGKKIGPAKYRAY